MKQIATEKEAMIKNEEGNMIKAIELAQFAEKNGWIVIDKGDSYIRYLTPSGRRVLVEFSEDGSVWRVYP